MSSMTSNHHLLYHLTERMLEQETHILLVDDLFDDEQVGDYVKSIQIDSPYQQLLLEGVLSESVKDENLYVCFTVEGYFHYVLGEVIHKQAEGKDAEFLNGLIRNNRLNGIKEGVEQCMIRDVNNGQLDRLIALIDLGSEAGTVARYPLAHAFMKMPVMNVFQSLMENPSVNDWTVIKEVRGTLLGNQKQAVSDELDGIIKEAEQLRNAINGLLEASTESEFLQALKLISFYSDLNALDQAKTYHTEFIEKAEQRGFNNALVEGLEHLGDSEYRRSGRDGYLAAMEAFTKSLVIREAEPIPQRQKLKHTYQSLGLAYLSLGLQVVKSNEYFEKAKAILLEESDQSPELAVINLYIGIVNFWRGLRGIGRWAHADPSLLEGLTVDLFDFADEHFQQAYNYYFRNLGKTHPQTLEAIHYLQENRYALGNYEKAIPWLKKYADVLPFKGREHTDNFYLYCLIVSLEETAKKYASSDPKFALSMLEEAKRYAKGYDEDGQIADRLNLLAAKTLKGEQSDDSITVIDELQPTEMEKRFTANWQIWEHAEQAKGFQTNPWLSTEEGVWFYNIEKGQLSFWNSSSESFKVFNPVSWPQGAGRMVYDPKSKVFYAWSSIRSEVYQLNSPYEAWVRLSYGVHDVHACGASFGYDPVNKRLFEFGGYGYFTYKNWLWVYDVEEKKWIQIRENKPGIAPYPRNGQLLPIAQGKSFLLLSGIGNDTGIQREHKARMGLASATDVGYFTWLRDAYAWDWKTMKWETLLSPNHASIRHEGVIGHMESVNMVFNWSGNIPSPVFGQEAITVKKLTCWSLGDNNGFKEIEVDGDIPPFAGGYFQPIPGKNELLYVHPDNIWKLTLHDR
jgi:tetratricopeptide (TPR) repeat protein